MGELVSSQSILQTHTADKMNAKFTLCTEVEVQRIPTSLPTGGRSVDKDEQERTAEGQGKVTVTATATLLEQRQPRCVSRGG